MNYTLTMWSRLQVTFFLLCIYAFIHTVMGRVKRWSMGFTHLLSKIVNVVTMQSMVVSVKWSANTSLKN